MKYLKRVPMSLFFILAGLGTLLDFTRFPPIVGTITSLVLGICGVLAGILYLIEKQPDPESSPTPRKK